MTTKEDGGPAFPIPNVNACKWGGWLAVSPCCWSGVKIGVTAATEVEARMKFGKSYGEWLENIGAADAREAELLSRKG